jgi:hypothetical protein
MGLEGAIYPYFEAQVFSYKCYGMGGIEREIDWYRELPQSLKSSGEGTSSKSISSHDTMRRKEKQLPDY